MHILVTGFEPYGADRLNASKEVVDHLPEVIGGHTIHRLILPTTFDRSIEVMDAALTRYRPELVIAVGESVGRKQITLERVAINVQDAPLRDNAGSQPVDEPVIPQGPAAYFSTLPIKAMMRALVDEGIPARVSNSAGTFVSNHLFYGLMHHLHHLLRMVRGGLVTVPLLPEQTKEDPNCPSQPLEISVRALELLILAADRRDDLNEPGGRIC